MRLLFVLATLLTCTSLGAQECSDLPTGTVEVRRSEPQVPIQQNYGLRTLKAMSQEYARPASTHVLGLTVAKGGAKVGVRTQLISNKRAGWECASHQLVFEYGYTPMTVYVASEFPAGSCAYEEILAHEQKHVAVYFAHARKIEQELREVLQQRFVNRQPERYPLGETRARLQQELDERWLPYIRRLLDAVKADQREVDSPEENERVAAACQGEITQRLRQITGQERRQAQP